MIFKQSIRLGLLGVMTFTAFACEAWIVTSMVEYVPVAVITIVIMVGILAFKFMSFRIAFFYMLGFLVMLGIVLPKFRQFGLNPYVETFQHDVREKIKGAKERDGQFPQDISPLLDQSAHSIGMTGNRSALLKARPYKYNPQTGDFSIELF